MQRITKHILFFTLILACLSSCRSKKTFNGVETLKCTTFEDKKTVKKDKKNSKYEIVVLKDGKIMGNKRKGKRGKSRLFK